MSHAIDVDQLRVDYGPLHALDGVSLRVDYGQIVTLLGPNGAGKTTLVETMLGFRAPHAGTVRLHGRDPYRDHAEVVARTGALLQRGGVWLPMAPATVLRLTAAYYEAPRDPDELLERLDLRSCARTPWRRLSGGEQQRTLLALALLGRPRALLLDEPTSSVDPEGRRVIRETIDAERQRGCAVVITTHELDEAERLADEVAILHQGRVVARGTLDELAGPDAATVVEVRGPVDVSRLAARLGTPVEAQDPTHLRVRGPADPQRTAAIAAALAEEGATLVALRTRASLEDRYLAIIAGERSRP